MSLPNYLAKIKSSGIYRFVWDKSEIAGVDAEILRLVVGYSEKGPFNTPVYVKTTNEFKQIFGDVSKKLEKRGVYFHRMALQALSAGPILCLNLKKFSDEVVKAASFDVVDTITSAELGVESIYDTTRFWKLSPEKIRAAYEEKQPTRKDKYIQLSSTDSEETSCSVIMRGAKTTGYDVTLTNWYASLGEEIPEYLKDYANLLVSDFFVDMYVFKGEFTPAVVGGDPLNKYFNVKTYIPSGSTEAVTEVTLKPYIKNAFGEIVDTLPLLAAESASNFVNQYTGILLPYFKNANGQYISLDLLFNTDNSSHKMMMNLDADLLYNGTVIPTDIISSGYTVSQKDTLSIKNLQPVTVTATYTETDGWKYGEKSDTEYPFDANLYKYALDKNSEERAVKVLDDEEMDLIPNPDSTKFEIKLAEDCFTKHAFGAKVNLPFACKKSDEFPVMAVEIVSTEDIVPTDFNILAWDITKTSKPSVSYVMTQGVDSKTVIGTCPGNAAAAQVWYFSLLSKKAGTFNITVKAHKDGDTKTTDMKSEVVVYDNAETIDNLLAKKWDAVAFQVGDRFVWEHTVSSKLKRELVTLSAINYSSDKKMVSYKLITVSGELVQASDITELVKCNYPASVVNKGVSPIYFKGYKYINAAPDSPMTMLSKLKWQQKILSAITEYDGIRLALTNRTDIDYRYIVDTFEAYVENEVHAPLALICKEKDNAMGLLNFPCIKTFKDCDYTKFYDAATKQFKVKYIAEGGNKQLNPSILFQLVSEVNGASYVSYNTPLTFTDGTVKTYVPSAALVSNNFMEKYLSRKPYYIVAGPTYGRMIAAGMVGPDFNYSRADLDILEPMGVNCMVYVPRLGTYINSNQTAKQNPVTALSKINVRELVIYLQDEIEKLLQDYQWEFNTQELRDKIKAKADVICENVKNNGGIEAFYNKCDEENNNADVIQNEMLVLSTSIEPGFGAGKMVQELTIHKRGGITSTIK